MESGSSAFFVTVSDAMRGIKATYDKGAGVSEADAIKALVDPKLLILDEVGADLGTDHNKVLLFDIINKRYEHVRPTIILTNLDQATLTTYFGERILDRLREGGGKLVQFTWASHRA
jgi:DNA replication protein DnaC